MADGNSDTRVTIRTVAADAGVSVAAVSKVMRNAYGVSEALRLKVEASIEKLGYRPSVAARGMRGQTFTLGVLLNDIENPFLPTVYHGIESVTEAAGYKIMVGVGATRARREVSLIEQMIDNRMDGLILVANQIPGETMDRYARQIPTVVVGHHEPSALSFDTVNNDDQLGARLAVEAFVERGHRDIAFLAQLEGGVADVTRQREIGYLAAMADAGLAPRVVALPNAGPQRTVRVEALLTASDRPRAIFCWSDLDAIPLLGEAHRLGVRVPGDLALIGYDNSSTAALPMVNLTSIDQDGHRMGRVAAQALLTRIGGRSVAEHIRIEPKLVLRNSC